VSKFTKNTWESHEGRSALRSVGSNQPDWGVHLAKQPAALLKVD
jgi:hypothetical protein